MDRYKLHEEICKKMTDTYIRKNKDYGNSFGETFQKLGIISAITRISDKYNRICNLAMNNERNVLDETIEDTLIDMSNYCVMTLIEIIMSREEKNDTREVEYVE